MSFFTVSNGLFWGYRGGMRKLWGLLWAGLILPGAVFAQAPVDPLGGNAGEEAEKVALRVWNLQSADQALRMGFSSMAVEGYRALLAEVPADSKERPGLEISLVSALIGESEFAEAGKVLDEFKAKEDPGYLLRRAVLAWEAGKWVKVREYLAKTKSSSLPTVDRGWYHFLQALAADEAEKMEEGDGAYKLAMEAAVSEAQRGFFLLGKYRARFSAGGADEAMLAELKKQVEAFHGKTTGYRFAQQYAMALHSLGKKEEAAKVIREQIQKVPAAERDIRDQFLLLDGLISGSEDGQGRQSLQELLETGGKRDLQRIALQKLAASVEKDTEAFRALLDRLIEQKHPLTEELHLFRGQLALRQAVSMPAGEARNGLFEEATADAELILTQFPGSRLKREALEVLAASAWEQRRYRTAANHLTQLRSNLPAKSQRRAEVALLVADCYFRAGEVNRAAEDYRNAADAYGTVLREHPGSVSPGLLVYQRVVAEIRGGRIAEAIGHLQGLSEDSGVEPVYRWQTEWNLVKAMQQRGQVKEAYERVTELLKEESKTIPEGDLRLRLEWLQAQLSFDAGKAAETLPLVKKVLTRVQAKESPVEGELKERIIAYSLLLQGQAQLELGKTAEALASLEEIRKRLPGSEPALYSMLVEARHYTRVNRTVDAQQMFISLADSYKESNYAAMALFEAALNAQRRGQDVDYQNQAIALLERLVTEYPRHPLAFYARLRQGDLLRQLNRFESAGQIYLNLENSFPKHPDAPLVQLSLADCYRAEAGQGDGSRILNAISILERLFDLPNLGPDLRAEAGFKLASASGIRGEEGSHERQAGRMRAQEIYWATVSSLYLDEKASAALGARGRYWVARCLLEYGQQFEREGRLDNARKAYNLIQKEGLPGNALATDRLSRLLPTGATQ